MKVTLSDVVNLQNETSAVNTINANTAVIETAFDNTLSRDGSVPNQMENSLDMNSHHIINLPPPASDNEPIRRIDYNNGVTGPKGDPGATGVVTEPILTNPEVIFDQIKEGAGGYLSTPGFENYGPDGFRYQGTGNGTFFIRRVTTAPTGFSNSLQVQTTVVNATPAHDDNYHVEIPIEAVRSRLLEFGTANAKTFTYQFQMAASTNGTYSVGFMNGINSRFYVAAFSYTGSGNFQQITITVPGDTAGTWSTAKGEFGLKIIHDFGTGSDYTTAASTGWAPGAFWKATGSYSLIAHSAAVFLTAFQIDIGSVAQPFRYVPYEDQLLLCQRYLNKSMPQGTAVAAGAGAPGAVTYVLQSSGTTIGGGAQVYFPNEMMSAPHMFFYGTINGSSVKWGNQFLGVESGTPTPFCTSAKGVFISNPQVAGDINPGNLMSIHYLADSTLGGI